MKKEMIQVDKVKFQEAMKKRGVSCREASLALGYNENFVNNSVYSKGRLSKPAVIGLKQLYNIDISEIELVPDEPEKPEEAVEPEVSKLDFKNQNELYKIIYLATYAAFKQALEEDGSRN
ncbi:MAG: hypothetical protein J6U54_05305 [Clostridiales bacterium]|nr:hypothetical protein [Clostridiales bacterium]